MPKTRIIHSTTGFELIRKLAQQGLHIFTVKQAKKIAPSVGIKKTYLNEALYHLTQSGTLIPCDPLLTY